MARAPPSGYLPENRLVTRPWVHVESRVVVPVEGLTNRGLPIRDHRFAANPTQGRAPPPVGGGRIVPGQHSDDVLVDRTRTEMEPQSYLRIDQAAPHRTKDFTRFCGKANGFKANTMGQMARFGQPQPAFSFTRVHTSYWVNRGGASAWERASNPLDNRRLIAGRQLDHAVRPSPGLTNIMRLKRPMSGSRPLLALFGQLCGPRRVLHCHTSHYRRKRFADTRPSGSARWPHPSIRVRVESPSAHHATPHRVQAVESIKGPRSSSPVHGAHRTTLRSPSTGCLKGTRWVCESAKIVGFAGACSGAATRMHQVDAGDGVPGSCSTWTGGS